jgi:hypothetical protein
MRASPWKVQDRLEPLKKTLPGKNREALLLTVIIPVPVTVLRKGIAAILPADEGAGIGGSGVLLRVIRPFRRGIEIEVFQDHSK